MRNLLFIHLESLNYTTYQTNKRLFPTLGKWEEKSVSFSRYFSTATSTLMVVSDLAYGGILQNEPCDSMVSGLDKYCYPSSLPDDLRQNGYRVRIMDYPAIEGSDVPKSNERHFVGFHVEMEEMRSYEQYMNALDDAMTAEEPFAVWACNFIGNVSYYQYMKDTTAQSGFELWESGYIHMDRCVDELLKILEKKSLLETTTVVFYGDHGDDFFSHGRHQGLLHAIEPYASLIHTPFWIYDNRLMPGETERLTDTTDIRRIVEKLLIMEEGNALKYRMEDLGLEARKYSLSRNAYAAQRVRERSFHKGYSLTDGRYLLLAGGGGMELYHMDMDAACQHNLLDYFDFQEGILLLNKAAYSRMKFHIKSVLDQRALSHIEHIFYDFREWLLQETERIYRYADSPDCHLEIDFEKIHYGWEERERRAQVDASGKNVIAETVNRLLNCAQINKMTVYGDTEDELSGIYPAVQQYRRQDLEKETTCEVVYISLHRLEELFEIKDWIGRHREDTTIFVYVKAPGDRDAELEKTFGLFQKFRNETLLKGTLYFAGRIFEYPDSVTVPESFKVLAVMHFYNEADILERTIAYLLSQGTDIYLVDNWSEDGSYEIAQQYRESFPDRIFLERFPEAGGSPYYDWYHQLERTEEIAGETDYDWYIHYDADEMRIGPWTGRNLRESLYYAGLLGFNAVDNLVIDFKLTGDDDRNIFMSDTYFAFRHAAADFRHRKTWRKTKNVDLKKTGGHIAQIEKPKIFPLKILNRHYPLRNMEQAYRKVFTDRLPRFEKENKERGWHGHYRNVVDRKDLLADRNGLILWDDTVRERYYASLFLGCGIEVYDREEFDVYRKYLEGKKIVLYGAGNYGKYFCEEMAGCAEIIAWTDRDWIHLPWFCCMEIRSAEEIKHLEFDAVFIAIAQNSVKQEVRKMLVQMGVPKEKIY